MEVAPSAAAAGVRLVSHDAVGSTNVEAMALARAGEAGPLWVTAARQTAGRGRRGNAWASQPGNLYASLLVTDAAPSPHLPELCFVVALAARDAICTVVPSFAPLLKLKWPNDLLLDGAKIVGILIEAERVGTATAAVIGIGINCAHHPEGTPYAATDLNAHGAAITPPQTFKALTAAMVERLALWDRGSGFAAIRAEWLTHAAGIGGDIMVRLPNRQLAGKFESLDQTGRLMLRLPEGHLEAITAGEVFPALSESRA
jgi:BirA family transcriptional regulator, biotin operon repressor / biotin---[acetyl-CoA-carboxylase] ligase